MEKDIKITKNLRIEYCDLIRKVDVSRPFTLKDVLRIPTRANFSILDMEQLIRCDCITELWEECNYKKFRREDYMDYLEIGWSGDIENEKIFSSNNYWDFHGVGKEGREVKKLRKSGVKVPKDYRQTYALGMSPVYKFSGYKIQMSNVILITDWRHPKQKESIYTHIEFRPSITLIDLLHAIYWELTWYGCPESRKVQVKELTKSLDKARKEIDEGKGIEFKNFKEFEKEFDEITSKK